MARTAPVPNIPPIPGMCPSLAVMAGGGGGGGGSGGSAGDADGSGNGDGSGSGEGASGDGRNAAAGQGDCPGGTPCPSHASSGGGASAGDPVDVVTGRAFTAPATDLFLPGLLPFHFTRRYSSSRPRRDVDFGPGWSHSLAFEIEVRREGLRFWTEDGTYVGFALVDVVGEHVVGRGGWRLARTPSGFDAQLNGITFHLDRPLEDGRRFALGSIENRNGAVIRLDRDAKGAVTRVVDSVGRVIVLTRGASGQPAALSVLLPSGARETMATYEYDEAGRLACVVDARGSRSSYAYDDAGRLASHRDPTGLTFHYRYDEQDRCVETWGDRDDAMPAGIMPDHPRTLADGARVRGILHVRIAFGPGGYSEVSNSETARRYFGNGLGKLDKEVHGGGPTTRTYDALGLVREMTDGEGLTTLLDRDDRGRVVRAVDRLGRTRTLERTQAGDVVREIDPSGAEIQRTFDAFGNKLTETAPDGATWAYRYDGGRLVSASLPNGGSFRVTWDGHANIAELVEPSGATWISTYDYFGRRLSIKNPLGVLRELLRDAAGDVVEIKHDGKTVVRNRYDALGRIVERWFPDGGVYRFEYGAFKRLVRAVMPDGGEVRLEHDLENRVRRIRNQKGEAHEFGVSPRGMLEEERTFDGRTTKYRFDRAGTLARAQGKPGPRVDMEYDAEGRLLSRTFNAELTHAFTYDAMDRPLSAKAPSVEVAFERDVAGRITSETFRVPGHAWTVERTYDPMGRAVRHRVKDWVDLSVKRDSEERIRAYELRGAGDVAVERDGLGRMVRATLPGGAVWQRTWDAFDLLVGQQVTDAYSAKSVDTTFRYDAVQLLRERTEEKGSTRYFEYDLLHQLVSVRDPARTEDYGYDATGNVRGGLPGASARTYGVGDRLEAVGGARCTHDDAGRIVTKETPDGRRWRYEYRDDGMLKRVIAPDGTSTESFYDASARRVLRKVWKDKKCVRTTGYVWADEQVLAEVELVAGSVEPSRVRTYLHHDHDGLVLGHCDREGTRTAWRFYMTEPGGMPTRLIDENGRVAERLDATAFGELASPARDTDVRFPGQIHDAEAGLHYNRHRHYDPALGRYLTPDPVGLWEGLNTYRYARNAPTALSDANGLGCLVTITGDQTTVSATSSTGGDWDPPTPGGSVATAVENTPIHQPSRAPWPPGKCAEASAVDRFLEDARAQPGNEHLSDRELLAQIPPGGIVIEHHDNPSAGNPRTPCPNCRQMLMELGIHPEQDDRIAGNPRNNSKARELNPDRRGASLS